MKTILNVDFLLVYLSPKVREIMLLFGAVFTMILSGIIAWNAWPMWWETVVENYHSMSLWGPPLWIPYFFIPLWPDPAGAPVHRQHRREDRQASIR